VVFEARSERKECKTRNPGLPRVRVLELVMLQRWGYEVREYIAGLRKAAASVYRMRKSVKNLCKHIPAWVQDTSVYI
jgi:hypothetical protein